MSIVGIFTRAQPSIDGYVFDAVLEESTELNTELTSFPIENGSVGNDHVLINPLEITMLVGISDNPFRSVLSAAGSFAALSGAGAGLAAGTAISRLGGSSSAVLGLGASIANANFAAGQAFTRSQDVLEALRQLQLAGQLINVVGSKRTYKNCVITSTVQETTKENEQGLELMVRLEQPLIINSSVSKEEIPASDDTAETQAQDSVDIGQVSLQ